MADVRRAVHGEYISGRHQEIHDAEDGLLHLPRIGSAADEHDTLGEVQNYEGLGGRAVTPRIGFEAGCGNHSELSLMPS